MTQGHMYKIVEEDRGNINYFIAIIFILIIVGFYGVIYAIDYKLPTPLKISDEVDNPNSFIAERARDYLKPLVDIGPKVAGHPNNEILAVNYLVDKIKEITTNAHPSQKISYDVQVQSGSFFLDYRPHGSINAYANMQNVIAKVHSKNESLNSILINTHFDTYYTSPGGSDDGIMVAVSLEILRKLSQSTERPTHNLIFLFNGAEEAGLVGSHAFLAHKWAEEVRVLVNLEASGAGGKEMLFQTGPNEPWLLKYYDVPHPSGNAAGEEVFQSNAIPSDTDFRIFRDFGGYIGYDIAFTRDGYRYHTKYDGIDNIELGVYQHTGDNVLQLIRNIAEAPEVLEPKTTDGGKTIFYDIFGLFFVYYSEGEAIIINSFVIVFSVLLLFWVFYSVNPTTGKRGLLLHNPAEKVSHTRNIITNVIYVIVLMLLVLLSWVLAVCVVALMATIMDGCNRSMTWYSVPALSFGLYAIPALAVLLMSALIIQRFIQNIGLTNSYKALIQVHIVRIIWTLLLLIGTATGLRMTYIIMIPVLFNVVAMIITHSLDVFKPKLTLKVWPFIYIISMIIPTLIIYSYGHTVLGLFIPILGRFGSGMNPDLLIGLMYALFTIMIASYYTPLLVYIKKPWYVAMVLGAVFIIAIILAATPVGFPYRFSETEPRLQRYTVYHTMRTIRNDQDEILKEDTGFYFNRNDRNTPRIIEGSVSSLGNATSLEEDCDIALACGLPITNSRSIKNLEDSIWIPAVQPPFNNRIVYNASTPKYISATKREYTVSIEGSNRIDVYLSIRKGYTLIGMNLVEELPESILTWNDQPTYFMQFKCGKSRQPFVLTFTVETSSDWSSPVADVAVTTKFIDDSFDKTKEFTDFLNEFPEWTVFMVIGLAQYENFVLH